MVGDDREKAPFYTEAFLPDGGGLTGYVRLCGHKVRMMWKFTPGDSTCYQEGPELHI